MRRATEISVERMQKIYDFLGKRGGTIETKVPGTWWKLYMDAYPTEDGETIASQIGVCNSINGDVIFDPMFRISMAMDGGKITSIDILEYESQTILGSLCIDGEDEINFYSTYGALAPEKDEFGLTARFENFMYNMVEMGPYLDDPAKVVHYTENDL